MDYKQQNLIKIIQERIESKEYTEYLPRAIDLAQEFQINVKTVHKALRQLVVQGVLERKRHSGTRIVPPQKHFAEDVIEVLFDGFTTIFTHPFWHNIWEPMIQKLSAAGFHTVLTVMECEPDSGLVNVDKLSFFPAAGRIILGSGEKILLARAAAKGIPFITACDPLDPAIPQISFDFTRGIHDAVEFLQQQGCRKIGFIGQTQSFVQPQQLNKFNAYLKAVQDFCQIDPGCIGSTRPVVGGGETAVKKILKTATPDALIVAYDHQLPEIMEVLKERKIAIPVIGCDGLSLPEIPADRACIKAPLRECGELVAEKIVQAINTHRKPASVTLEAKFDGGSLDKQYLRQ